MLHKQQYSPDGNVPDMFGLLDRLTLSTLPQFSMAECKAPLNEFWLKSSKVSEDVRNLQTASDVSDGP